MFVALETLRKPANVDTFIHAFKTRPEDLQKRLAQISAAQSRMYPALVRGLESDADDLENRNSRHNRHPPPSPVNTKPTHPHIPIIPHDTQHLRERRIEREIW